MDGKVLTGVPVAHVLPPNASNSLSENTAGLSAVSSGPSVAMALSTNTRGKYLR